MANQTPPDTFISGYLATVTYNFTTKLYTGRFAGLRGEVVFFAYRFGDLEQSGKLALDDYFTQLEEEQQPK